MGNSLDPPFVLVYYFAMTSIPTTPPPESAQTADSQEVRSQFEVIIADMVWRNSVADYPIKERLGELLAFPIGMDLLHQLRDIKPATLEPDQRLIYLHLWERCVGWVTDQAAAAAAGFIDAITDPPDERMCTRAGVDIADETSLAEVAITTGLSTNKAAMRIISGNVLAPDGVLAATGDALRSGQISLEVATAFVDATLGLTDDIATQVQNRVLPRAVSVINPDNGAGCWRTRAWAVRELRRALIAVDPDTIAKKRERATAGRYVDISFDHYSGMAYLTAHLPAHLAMELHNILNALATRLRDNDQALAADARPRSWRAARADALVEAIRAAGTTLADTGALPSVHGKTRIEVGVIIDLPTLVNLAEHPGEILGYGPIDPHYARLLAAQADVWRRWVVEPTTGHLLDLGRTKYKPTQELRDYILAAYPQCSVPECERHAPGLEIDHVTAWHDDGPTSAENLHALCWKDHLRKTNNHVGVRMNADGTVTHTTRHGLTRTSEPYWHWCADNLTNGRTMQGDDTPPF